MNVLLIISQSSSRSQNRVLEPKIVLQVRETFFDIDIIHDHIHNGSWNNDIYPRQRRIIPPSKLCRIHICSCIVWWLSRQTSSLGPNTILFIKSHSCQAMRVYVLVKCYMKCKCASFLLTEIHFSLVFCWLVLPIFTFSHYVPNCTKSGESYVYVRIFWKGNFILTSGSPFININ